MEVSTDIAARSLAMVDHCGLDTMSIFIRDRTCGDRDELSYLYHHNVSPEAQDAYMRGRVFADDPFTRGVAPNDRTGSLIRWGDRRLSRLAGDAHEYRSFIASYDVAVVGAWVQQVVPGLFLVIGAHCKPVGKRVARVPMERLAHETGAIAQMVVGELFQRVLESGGGFEVLHHLLNPCQDSAQDALALLSPREREIALLVGDGKQNKQIAWTVGISEFTVENHLRSIYRKLDVRNRTAMTARLMERPTWQ